MSRAKGYKCFNIKCGSCIRKTLCGEPEDTALVCVDRVIGKPMTNADRIRSMTDEELVEFIKNIKVRAALCKAVKNNDAFEELCSAEWLQQPAEDDHDERKENENA